MTEPPTPDSSSMAPAEGEVDAVLGAPKVPTLAELESHARGVGGAVRLHISRAGTTTEADRGERVRVGGDGLGREGERPVRGTLEEVGADGRLVVRGPGMFREAGTADGFILVQVRRKRFAWGCRCTLEHVADVPGITDELRYTFRCDPAHAWVPSRRSWRYRLPSRLAASASIVPLVESAPPQPGAEPANSAVRRPRPLEPLAVRARLVDVGEGGLGCEIGVSARATLTLFDRFLVEVPAPVPGGRGFAAVVRLRNHRENDGGGVTLGFEFEHARMPESLQYAYVLTDVTRFVALVSGSDDTADAIRAA